MNRQDYIQEIHSVLREVGYKADKAAVEICGKLYYLQEHEIRALQVIAARRQAEGPKAFEKFMNDVKIYNNRYKHKATKTIEFREDGSLKEPYFNGFFDVCDNLALKLWGMSPILHAEDLQ